MLSGRMPEASLTSSVLSISTPDFGYTQPPKGEEPTRSVRVFRPAPAHPTDIKRIKPALSNPRKAATTQWLFYVPAIPDFSTRPGHNNQQPDLTSLLFDLLGLLFQPDNPIIGEACQRKQLTFNFLSAQAAGPRIRNATACFSVVPRLGVVVSFRWNSVRKPEGRLCECWKILALPCVTGISKKKEIEFHYVLNAFIPICDTGGMKCFTISLNNSC